MSGEKEMKKSKLLYKNGADFPGKAGNLHNKEGCQRRLIIDQTVNQMVKNDNIINYL